MRLWAFINTALIALAMLPACSLLLSSDGLSEREGGGTTDAAAEGGGIIDMDAGSMIEAGDGPSFCARRSSVFFCDDFDDPKRPMDFVWLDGQPSLGATVETSTMNAASRPSSARIVSPFITGTDLPNSSRARDITWPTPRSEITTEMSVYFDPFPSQSTAKAVFGAIFLFHPEHDSLSTRIVFERRSNGAMAIALGQAIYVGTGNPPIFEQAPLSTIIPTGRWVRLVRHLDLRAPPKETLSVDGIAVATLDLRPEVEPVSRFRVHLGFYYTSGPSDPFSVYIDDVVVDGK